jgi:hypothetical protein
MSADPTTLDELVRRLEEAAARLRAEDIDPAEAADLVERCADLAARLSGELERQARSGEGSSPGQETLL